MDAMPLNKPKPNCIYAFVSVIESIYAPTLVADPVIVLLWFNYFNF